MYQRINFTDHLAIQRFILLNVFFVLVVNNNQESAISDTFPLEAAPPSRQSFATLITRSIMQCTTMPNCNKIRQCMAELLIIQHI